MAGKQDLSDERIIEMYFERNGDAVEETGKKYGNYLFSVIKNFVCGEEDCKECLNDTYLDVWNSIPPARPSSFKSFIGRIARNNAVSFYRKTASEKRAAANYTLSLDELAEAIPCFDDADARLVREVMERFLKSLPPRGAKIFVLRYYYAAGLQEIAKETGLSVSGVHKTLEKMKSQLRKELEDEGINV